jgi:hypothetical protein
MAKPETEDPFLQELGEHCPAPQPEPETDPFLEQLADRGAWENDPQRAAIAAGEASKPCDPKQVVCVVRQRIDRKPPRRQLSRAQTGEWLVQAGVDAVLGAEAALLLLRVTSYVSRNHKTSKLYAWIGRSKLALVAGHHRKTVDVHARKLTGPLLYNDAWHPPLFRIDLIGRGLKRRAEWIPLLDGWRQLIEHLASVAQARKDAEEAKRAASSAPKGRRNGR